MNASRRISPRTIAKIDTTLIDHLDSLTNTVRGMRGGFASQREDMLHDLIYASGALKTVAGKLETLAMMNEAGIDCIHVRQNIKSARCAAVIAVRNALKQIYQAQRNNTIRELNKAYYDEGVLRYEIGEVHSQRYSLESQLFDLKVCAVIAGGATEDQLARGAGLREQILALEQKERDLIPLIAAATTRARAAESELEEANQLLTDSERAYEEYERMEE